MKNEYNINLNSASSPTNTSDNPTQPHKRKQKSMHRKTNSQIFGFEDLKLLDLENTQTSYRPVSAVRLSNNNPNIESFNFAEQIQNPSPKQNISYEEDELNSSVIIKDNDNNNNNSNQQSNNSTTKSGSLHSTTKSFIPLVNTLKFVREKEENATESYLLALGFDKEEKNKDYNVGSVIEEEKSDMLISESDFSSKKKILAKFGASPIGTTVGIAVKKKELDGVNVNLNEIKFEDLLNNKGMLCSNNNNEKESKFSLTINEMMKRKEEKDKNHRNQLTNNKMCLLNTFYTLTNAKGGNNQNANNNNNNNNNNMQVKNIIHQISKNEQKTHSQRIIENKRASKYKKNPNNTTTSIYENNNNNTNINSNKGPKKTRRTLSQNMNSTHTAHHSHKSKIDQETTRKINELLLKNNIKIHHSKTKSKDKAIPFTNTNTNNNNNNSTTTTLRHKLIIPNHKLSSISHNKNQTADLSVLNGETDSIPKIPIKNLHYHIKKKTIADLSHITNDKDEVQLTKNPNFSNTLTLIQSHRNSKISIHNNQNHNNNILNNINNNNTSQFGTNNTTSANTHSHTHTRTYTRSNSRSSRTKEKAVDVNQQNVNGCFKKTKSQCNFHCVLPISVNKHNSSNNVNVGNYVQTANTLKHKLGYMKSYEKKDVIDKILASTSCGYYLIMCDNKKSHSGNAEFMFMGLFKYYGDKERFIKIYGNEKCQNVVQLKQITTQEDDGFDIYATDAKTKEFEKESKYDFNEKSYVILKTKKDKK